MGVGGLNVGGGERRGKMKITVTKQQLIKN